MRKVLFILIVLFTFLLVGCGRTTTQTTEVQTTETQVITTIVNDEITLVLETGQDTIEINTEWVDVGAKFVVNDAEYLMSTTDEVNESLLGLYEIGYTYEYQSETYTITRYVIVTDQTAPVMELNLGVDTVEVGATWTDTGVTVSDNSLETITPVVSGTVNTDIADTYEITYTATDSSGNISTIIRYVTVIE
jgi:hypothetical protein